MPINLKGKHDEWYALIQLSQQVGEKEDKMNKIRENHKKRSYMQDIKNGIEERKQIKQQIKSEKDMDAMKMAEFQRALEAEKQKEKELRQSKKKEIMLMNYEQMVNFQNRKAKEVYIEKSFKLPSTKPAEEKEQHDKQYLKQRQKSYAR